MRADTVMGSFELLKAGSVDISALPRPNLIQWSNQLPGSRLLADRFGVNLVAIAVPKGTGRASCLHHGIHRRRESVGAGEGSHRPRRAAGRATRASGEAQLMQEISRRFARAIFCKGRGAATQSATCFATSAAGRAPHIGRGRNPVDHGLECGDAARRRARGWMWSPNTDPAPTAWSWVNASSTMSRQTRSCTLRCQSICTFRRRPGLPVRRSTLRFRYGSKCAEERGRDDRLPTHAFSRRNARQAGPANRKSLK